MTSKTKLADMADALASHSTPGEADNTTTRVTKRIRARRAEGPKPSPVRTRTGKVSPPGNRGNKPGQRKGGRAPGTKNKSTVEYEQKLAEAQVIASENISHAAVDVMDPLSIIIHAMRYCAHQGLLWKACEFAVMALPYCSPRLSTVVTRNVNFPGDVDVSTLSDQELHDQLVAIRRRTTAGATVDGEAAEDSEDDGLPKPGSKLQ
jgi:hypothetical protein